MTPELEAIDNLHTLMQTLRFALSPEGGENGWRPSYGVDPLVDLALAAARNHLWEPT